MIKINLLAHRRKVRRRSVKGQEALLVALLILGAAGAGVYFVVDRPLSEEVKVLKRKNADSQAENQRIRAQVKGLAEIRAAVKAAEEREAAIERLRGARAAPAWLLHELSTILTRGGKPTITPEMRQRLETDPNRQFQETWDPRNVWLVSFEEKAGDFKLIGGAHADSDMTQLALRLQASMFFEEVQPEGGNMVTDRDTGLPYYQFTISGKVRY